MKKKFICIIPARGGSKRIKNKNIISFYGKPIIAHSILTAIKSKIFDRVIISTDSKKIAKIATKYGAEVPFLRPKKLSNDSTIIKNVLKHAIVETNSQKYNYFCCIYPTAPLINSNDLKKAQKKILKHKASALIAITRFNNHPFRMLKLNKKYIKFYQPAYEKTNTQNVPEFYHDSGSFYFYKTKNFLKSNRVLPKKTIPFLLEKKRSADINTSEDLDLAKALYKKK
jgi:pseudaminic acid cytidylyltransferase